MGKQAASLQVIHYSLGAPGVRAESQEAGGPGMKPRPSNASSNPVWAPVQWAPALGAGGGAGSRGDGKGGALRTAKRPAWDKSGQDTLRPKGLIPTPACRRLHALRRRAASVWLDGCGHPEALPVPGPGREDPRR